MSSQSHSRIQTSQSQTKSIPSTRHSSRLPSRLSNRSSLGSRSSYRLSTGSSIHSSLSRPSTNLSTRSRIGKEPRMFQPLLRAAERIAVGINNKASLPSRGRLLTLFKKYVPYDSDDNIIDEPSFKKLLEQEFRNIPANTHQELFDYICQGKFGISVDDLVTMVLPERFTKERSVLDFPCTYENASTAKEDVNDAGETIRFEMIDYLRGRRMRMRDYFNKIDADNDNLIDTRELIAGLRHDGMAIGRYHACRSLVHRFDSSRRGRLTFADFERLMQPEKPQAQQRLSKIAQAMLNRLGNNGSSPSSARKQQQQYVNRSLQKNPEERHEERVVQLQKRQMRRDKLQKQHPTLASRAADVTQNRHQKLQDLKRHVNLVTGEKTQRESPNGVPFLIHSVLQQKDPWM